MATKDNLQEIVDQFRTELARGQGGYFKLEYPGLPGFIFLDVIPDGVTSWLVRVKHNDRSVQGVQYVKPDEFVSSLYVFLRAVIRQLMTPAPKPS